MRRNRKQAAGAGLDVARAMARGQGLEQAGRMADAVRVYTGILSLMPRHADARFRLGVIALNEGDTETALLHFEKAARANPKSAAMRANTAMVHMRRLEYHKALPHLRKALSLDPALLNALRNLGECLFMLGDLDGARTWLEKAHAAAPENTDIRFEIGRLERASGNMAEAERIYRDLIARDANVSRAYSGLATSRKFAAGDPELDDIERLLDSDRLSRQDRQNLAYAAGKIAADRNEDDRAFDHFRTANASYSGKFDLDNFAAYVDTIRSTITPEYFAQRQDFGSRSDRPVFIFGMPRSGTSLVEHILASHPDFAGADEVPFFNAMARQLGATAKTAALFPQVAAALTRRDTRRIAKDYLELLAHHSRSTRRVSDKLPHNFERLWLLALIFPDAAFIHCRRDPVANCVSCYINPLNEQHVYATDLEILGRYYRLYDKLMAHWNAVLPVKMLECRYEALIADPETVSRRLVDHVGLPWHDDCLGFHENRRAVRTLSGMQVRQPVYRSSLDGWRRYEKHLQPLLSALGDMNGGNDPLPQRRPWEVA